MTVINESLFSNCTNLTSVIIPSSVKTIDDSAFKDCTSLTSVIIPSSVKTIGSDVFSGCNNLSNVTFKGNPINIINALKLPKSNGKFIIDYQFNASSDQEAVEKALKKEFPNWIIIFLYKPKI
jgi:hypothetical protein